MIVYTYSVLFSPGDIEAAFVDLSEQRTVIHDVPNAVADFFEADVFSAKDLTQEGLLGVEPERARATDTTDFQVRRIGGRGDVLGIRTGRRRPERRGGPVPDALVRAFVVVAHPKGVEPPLLRAQATRSGTGGLALQIAMHPFVGAVFLRTGWRNPLVDDAE